MVQITARRNGRPIGHLRCPPLCYDPDKLREALRAGRAYHDTEIDVILNPRAAYRNDRAIGLLDATISALKCQISESRARPRVKQVPPETEFFVGLSVLYPTIGGTYSIDGEAGPFYKFCEVCAELAGIAIPSPAALRKRIFRAKNHQEAQP